MTDRQPGSTPAILLGILWILVLSSCGEAQPGNPGASPRFETLVASSTPPPSRTATTISSPSPAPTVTPTEIPSPTATPHPFAGMTIPDLITRSYGGGELKVEDLLTVNAVFTRTLVTYPSDGLTIYGFMNVPRNAEGPLPVIVAMHGYIDPGVYNTLDYTTHYADALARAGYIVLHPNLRGYPPSDGGPNLFRVGMAIDVLNLVHIVRQTAGQPGPLARADGDRIGLWGHSMGGGISTRVITVDPGVSAAVLYGAMSGDEAQNFAKILEWSGGERGLEELAATPEELLAISPIYFLDRIEAAVSIHHGGADGLVPLEWSTDLCQRLTALAKVIECYTYPDQPHTFIGDGDRMFIQRTIEFYDRHLRR